MTHDEFGTQMDRLKSVYGDQKYPVERVKAIWSEMRYVHVQEFTLIVTELIAGNIYAPMIDKFRDAKTQVMRKTESSRRQSKESWTESQPACGFCGRLGYVMARHAENKLLYAFSCPCDTGVKLSYSYPKWSDLLSIRFTPLAVIGGGAERHVQVLPGDLMKGM